MAQNVNYKFSSNHKKAFQDVLLRMSENSENNESGLLKKDFKYFIEKSTRVPYVKVSRKRMNLPFAVQLMRNSYSSVDDLDFVPMNTFQRLFFLFRQNEWEDYRNYHKNILQGDLSDPDYFDFISFAQYAVISDQIKVGKYNFIELINAEGTAVRVERDKITRNNDVLSKLHSELVGDKLLA